MCSDNSKNKYSWDVLIKKFLKKQPLRIVNHLLFQIFNLFFTATIKKTSWCNGPYIKTSTGNHTNMKTLTNFLHQMATDQIDCKSTTCGYMYFLKKIYAVA